MRSHWPTAISTEPPCTQLTPSSANEHVENADTRGAEIAQNEPLPIDPLENEIGQNRKATNLEPSFRSAPIPVVCGMAMEPPGSTHLRHPAFTFGTVLHAPKRTLSNRRTGRLRRRAGAPDRLLRPAGPRRREESNQPCLVAVRRP